MKLRLVDDKKLTKLLDRIYYESCPWCPLDKSCPTSRKYNDGTGRESPWGGSKHACFRELRNWLTPGEK